MTMLKYYSMIPILLKMYSDKKEEFNKHRE